MAARGGLLFHRLKWPTFSPAVISFDDKSKEQLKQILEGWLATIESTQNPALIRSALQKYRELPYPSDEDKQLIIDDLIAVGYSNLKIEDMVK